MDKNLECDHNKLQGRQGNVFQLCAQNEKESVDLGKPLVFSAADH